MNLNENKIAIIGLGYVGLPLSVEFGKSYKTIGFDIDISRINDLNKGIDKTKECSDLEIKSSIFLSFTNEISDIKQCNVFIITVPTPIDIYKSPNLKPLIKASEMIGKLLKPDDIVIYESTVFPGCTEEVCVPVLEAFSKMKFNKDFFVGYSPERINPGDKLNRLVNIKKVTSGSDKKTSLIVDDLYKSIINAGTHLASSIKVAEASKAIENAQRDLNISFVNELAIIFDKLGIDTTEVLEAAGSKWNFLKFKPGLVGGHCIGVDPYYLAFKAQSIGYYPEVILAGRRVNDSMGIFIAQNLISLLIKNKFNVVNSNVLILGFTFKENCPDIRNTRVIDVVNELKNHNINVDVYDPIANSDEVYKIHKLRIINKIARKYDAIILAVAHDEFKKLDFLKIKSKKESVIYDLKSFINKELTNKRL
jgi:UDP-N-acetyl-D-galactosamine dehydrogenase